MKTYVRRLAILILILAIQAASRVATAIPNQISISGLVDLASLSVTFPPPPANTLSLPIEVKFYDSDAAPDPVETYLATAYLESSGIFRVSLTATPALLALDQVFYTIALDLNENGIGAEDLFDERFQMGSVPFALSAQPVNFFTTLPGVLSGSSTGAGWVDPSGTPADPFTALIVCPFVTPAGGVTFNKMSGRFGNDNGFYWTSAVTISFGIYSETGQLVVGSGAVNLPFPSAEPIVEVSVPQTTLEPSRLYFGAWTASRKVVSIPMAPSPPTRGNGYLIGVTSGGNLPASFNPDNILNDRFAPACFALFE